MCSWVLHRITGVAIFFFLLVHILDTALIRVSPEAYDAVIGTYKNPVMGIGEVALVGAIAYHAFNGLRIILVDFWGGPRATSASCGGSSWACGSSRCSASRRVTSSTSSPTWEGVTDDRSARLDRPRTAHPQPGLEPGEVGLGVHARLRRAPGRLHLRAPVRQPPHRRRHPPDRFRLRRRQVRLAVLAVVGRADAVARPRTAHPGPWL